MRHPRLLGFVRKVWEEQRRPEEVYQLIAVHYAKVVHIGVGRVEHGVRVGSLEAELVQAHGSGFGVRRSHMLLHRRMQWIKETRFCIKLLAK